MWSLVASTCTGLHLVARLGYNARMSVPHVFASRLRLALGKANLSPAALGAAVGVDKSVVSRWLSGRVRPTQHNLARIASALAERLPGFSVLSFDSPDLMLPKAGDGAANLDSHALPVPFALLESARNETARRGMEYFGTYWLYYWSFGQPGRLARMALILRPEGGLIEARYGADGFSFRGWALLMLNRMYLVMSEERFEAMVFLVLNAGQQPKARFITGVLTGPAEGLLVPTSAGVVLVRTGDLSQDAEADLAKFDRDCAFSAFVDEAEVPAAVLTTLRRATSMNGPLLQVPFANGEDEGSR